MVRRAFNFARGLAIFVSFAVPALTAAVNVAAIITLTAQAGKALIDTKELFEDMYVSKEKFKEDTDRNRDDDERKKCDAKSEADQDSPVCGAEDCEMGSDGRCTLVSYSSSNNDLVNSCC
jgi:uncharacterized membrane protein YhiD involved in acid resistance